MKSRSEVTRLPRQNERNTRIRHSEILFLWRDDFVYFTNTIIPVHGLHFFINAHSRCCFGLIVINAIATNNRKIWEKILPYFHGKLIIVYEPRFVDQE